jgi:hypothetical protein
MAKAGVGNNFDLQAPKIYNPCRVDEMKIIIKKVFGVILIIVGLLALLTPLTPGSWLALIGMELLGIRMFFFKKFLSEKHRTAAEKFIQKLKFKSKQRHANKPDAKKPQ